MRVRSLSHNKWTLSQSTLYLLCSPSQRAFRFSLRYYFLALAGAVNRNRQISILGCVRVVIGAAGEVAISQTGGFPSLCLGRPPDRAPPSVKTLAPPFFPIIIINHHRQVTATTLLAVRCAVHSLELRSSNSSLFFETFNSHSELDESPLELGINISRIEFHHLHQTHRCLPRITRYMSSRYAQLTQPCRP